MYYRQVRCPVAEASLADGIVLNLHERMRDEDGEKLAAAVAKVARRAAR